MMDTATGWRALAMFVLLSPASGRASTAIYEVTFDAIWSLETHPQDFPPGPHFSGLIGGTHNADVVFLEPGGLASLGIERMAERGSKAELEAEVNASIEPDGTGDANSVISGRGINPSPRTITETFPVDSSHPLVTLVSMIAPSPDWFVGVSGLDLRPDGVWRDVTVPLYPYDAGTDSGPTFRSPNDDTDPQEPIARIEGAPFVDADPLGTFAFRLVDLDPAIVPGDLDGNGGVDFDDISPLVLGLNNAQAYATQYGVPASLRGDLDDDNDLDFDDIQPFVSLLRGDGLQVERIEASFSSVPEPSTFTMALAAILFAALFPRRSIQTQSTPASPSCAKKGEPPLFWG